MTMCQVVSLVEPAELMGKAYHIDYVMKRVRGKMYSINRLNPPPAVRKLLYQVHILPIAMLCGHPLLYIRLDV